MSSLNLDSYVDRVPDFPKPGILFYDISPILYKPEAFRNAVDRLAEIVANISPDILIAIEARGFLAATAIAYKLGLGFALIRKNANKIPGKVISYDYELEYGTDTLAIKSDVIQPNAKVLIIDDLIATGGTVSAAYHLINKLQGKVVGGVFIIELLDFKARERLDIPIESLLQY